MTLLIFKVKRMAQLSRECGRIRCSQTIGGQRRALCQKHVFVGNHPRAFWTRRINQIREASHKGYWAGPLKSGLSGEPVHATQLFPRLFGG